jgi:hypothetical protein
MASCLTSFTGSAGEVVSKLKNCASQARRADGK